MVRRKRGRKEKTEERDRAVGKGTELEEMAVWGVGA